MRLPRNHKIFRGQLDAAPFAAVFFLLCVFLVFNSGLVFTPGVPMKLPVAGELPGLTNQAVVVAVAANGILFYENQVTPENELKVRLRSAAKNGGPLTLVLQADVDVRYEKLVELCLMARDAGIQNTWFATRPELKPVPLQDPSDGPRP
jgi:biopolymer transport protein ExbD